MAVILDMREFLEAKSRGWTHKNFGKEARRMAKKILIVDDEPDMVLFYRTVLEEKGYEVRGLTSAQEAISALDKERPDLILLDLVMPDKTGITLFRDLKKDERYKDIPIVLITGIKDVMGGDHKKFFEGLKTRVPAAYLEKPVAPKTLLDTVARVLGS
jgi:CheY-like chemotaxis protein